MGNFNWCIIIYNPAGDHLEILTLKSSKIQCFSKPILHGFQGPKIITKVFKVKIQCATDKNCDD